LKLLDYRKPLPRNSHITPNGIVNLDCWMLFRSHIIEVGVVAHASNTSYSGGGSRRIMSLRPICAKIGRPYLKNKI
jgi:hypothetical protein